MKNVNTNKVVSQIKVHGTPADKTNFWFSIKGDLADRSFHIRKGKSEKSSADIIIYDMYYNLPAKELFENYGKGMDEFLGNRKGMMKIVSLKGSYLDLTVKQICLMVLQNSDYINWSYGGEALKEAEVEIISFYKPSLRKVFRHNEKMMKLAQEVINRIDYDAKEMSDELIEAVDAAIVWTEDKWTIIQYYSTPDHPKRYDDAVCYFLDDLTDCI